MSQGSLEQPLLQPQAATGSSVSVRQLYRFLSGFQNLVLLVGAVSSVLCGSTMPLFSYVFGDMVQNIVDPTKQNIFDAQLKASYKLGAIGLFAFVFNFLATYCWNYVGQRQSFRIRVEYYKSILRQPVGWYDSFNSAELNPSSKIEDIQTAIGEKMGVLLQMMSMFVLGMVLGFLKGWQLALALVLLFPLIGLGGALMVWALKVLTSLQNLYYEIAGGATQQVLSSIRTIKSLSGEEFEGSKFKALIKQATETTRGKALLAGLAIGFMMFSFYSVYGVGFWYGTRLIVDGDINPATGEPYNIGSVMAIFFCIVIGGSGLGQSTAQLQALAKAKGSAQKIFELIDKQPESNGEIVITKIESIVFDKVCFRYPTKSDRTVLNGVSFQLKSNESVAFVGETGCGKSTIVQLLLRFYRPESGKITVNGHDLNQLQIFSFRKLIGYVGQEPALFATSIRENLHYSLPEATQADIWKAIKQANASQFVESLKDKIDTYVGSMGANISGGQKQRIAIARALIRNPQLVVFDEATSALDRANEQAIQNELNSLCRQLTSIVIAHRLSTIIGAKKIVLLGEGKVLQQGSHQQLVEARGKYFELFRYQEEHEPEAIVKSVAKQQQKAFQAETEESPVDEAEKKKVFSKIMKITLENPLLLVLSLLFSALAGANFPAFSILYSDVLALFTDPIKNLDEINTYCLYFIILAAVAGLVIFVQNFVGTLNSQAVSVALRDKLIDKILRLPVPFFDVRDNSSTQLNKVIFDNVNDVRRYFEGTIGTMIMNVVTLFFGFGTAFYSNWLMALASILLSPLILVSAVINVRRMIKLSKAAGQAYRSSNQQVSFTLSSIRTIYSLGNNQQLVNSYSEKLNQPLNIQIKKAFGSGLSNGFSQASMFLVYAGLLLIAAYLVGRKQAEPQGVFRAIFCMVFAAVGLGNNSKMMPDQAKAVSSGVRIFSILDQKDERELAETMKYQTAKAFSGDIQFKSVSFKYPNRNEPVLKDVSFKVKAGEAVGFAGESGCGKSTICQLILRFYQPTSGQILIDGKSSKDISPFDIRRGISAVFQQPRLFQGTIEENICYSNALTKEQLRQVCQQAQAFKFISQAGNGDFEKGLKSKVGAKGELVSGGQKQRIAIARCLSLKKNVVILDEATSALDVQTEKRVETNLVKSLGKVTRLVVAHRAASLENCRKIQITKA